MSDREVLAERLDEAGLLEDRLIPVRDGEKASVVDHHKAENRRSNFESLSGNYGVYAGSNPEGDRWLIDVDVDDYNEDADTEGLDAVNSLPETLVVETPHTDGETGGHRYYVVPGRDIPQRLKDAIGVKNPKPTWGEVRVNNQYVVGPGSQLAGCDKDWCEECATESGGYYCVSTDSPIAEIEFEELLDVLRASGYETEIETGSEDEAVGTDAAGDAIEVARNDPKIVTYLTEGAHIDFDGDRSDADFYVACEMVKNYVPEEEARALLEDGFSGQGTPPTKVAERGSKYWRRTWENAREKVQEDRSDSGCIDANPIVVDSGRTYVERDGEREQVLNFALDVVSILRFEDGEVIQAELRRADGPVAEVQFEPRHLQKKQRFKDNVLSERVGLTFDPPNRGAESVLNALNEYIGKLDVPVRDGTHHIGLHGSEWVAPRGVLDAEGWADDPDTVYVERNVGLERKVTLPTESAEYDTGDVAKIVRSLPQTRAVDRFLPVLAWFYAAPLRSLIFDEWNASKFNHLSITGDTGSGKTTTLRYLWRCFGAKGDPFSVTDTKFTMTATMAASNGLPVWYDEFKPSSIQDYKLDSFHELYRKAATGQIESRGNPDQTTTEYELHAPVVVSGEEQIRKPAERRRSIMVAFRKDVTEKGTDTWLAFKELAGEGHVEDGELVLPSDVPEPGEHALAYYRWIAGADTADLRAMWQDARELVWQFRQGWDSEHDLDDLEIQGLRTVAFGWETMRQFGQDHGVDLDNLPSQSDLDEALQHVVGEIGADGQRKSHMDKFIELFVRARTAGYLERGDHFAFVRENQPDEQLRIHLGQTFDALSKYAKDHDLSNQDLLSNASDYRKRFKEAAESGGGYVTEWSQYTPGMGRCVSISTVRAMRELSFDRSIFDVDPLESAGDVADAAADGGEYESARHEIHEFLRLSTEKGDHISAPSVAGQIDMDPDRVAELLDKIATETKLLARQGDQEYEVISSAG